MSEELKPCMRCGSDVIVKHSDYCDGLHTVFECMSCGLEICISHTDDKNEAIKIYNANPSEDALRHQLEEANKPKDLKEFVEFDFLESLSTREINDIFKDLHAQIVSANAEMNRHIDQSTKLLAGCQACKREHAQEVERLREVVNKLIEWNQKYPYDHVYSHHEITIIADEMNEIYEQALAAEKNSLNGVAENHCVLDEAIDENTASQIAFAANAFCQELPEEMQPVCVWKMDADPFDTLYETSCGECFQFTNDGPAENKFTHCPYCGLKLFVDEDRQQGKDGE